VARTTRAWILSLLFVCTLLGISLAACQAEPVNTPTPSPYPPGVFVVDLTKDLGEISKYVLGVNHGVADGLAVGNLEPAKNGGFTFLRWPGGNWGDQNDVTQRQIDNYIAEARMMGAEPSITVRLPNSTPEKAAEMVRYVNLEKQYGVTYWSIGNETSLYEKSTNYQKLGFNAVTIAQEWRRFALAMKAVDPTIKLYGPDIHQFGGDPAFDPKDAQGRLFLQEFLKINADLVDVVTVHRYPFPTCQTCGAPTVNELLANTPDWDNIIPNLRRVIQETTSKELPVGVTEYNSNYSVFAGGETSPDSFYGAIWLADALGRMIRQRPEILTYWTLKSNTAAGFGLLQPYGIRPSYYVFQIYKRFGNHLLAANSDDEMVSLFAAKKDDGSVTLIFVNRSDALVKKALSLEKGDKLNLSQVYLFDKDHNAETVSPPSFKNGDPIELGPLSVTLSIFTP
jgi:hypothetical protein